MKKPEIASGVAAGRCSPAVSPSMSARPLLWHFLVDETWDDGSPRDRGTILLFADGGVVKAWLNDKACGRAAWVHGESWDGCLDAIEEGLEADSLAWREARAASSNKSSRRT